MNMKRKIIKKKSHRIIWRTCTILLGIFLMIYFFGAYVFYSKNTNYHQRNFGDSKVNNVINPIH